MTFLVSLLLSPSQIGPAITRMSAASTRGNSSGHASTSHPCSRMSGYTPVAMGWSTARNRSTVPPCFAMIDALASTSSWVWLGVGERVSVVLTNRAVRSLKSVSVSVIGGP